MSKFFSIELKFKRWLKAFIIILGSVWLFLFFVLRNPTFTSGDVLENPAVPEVRELRDHVKFLAEMRPNRSFENPESLDAAARYIEERLRNYGYKVASQEFTVSGRKVRNLIVRYGDASSAKRLVVVGAHYDACEIENPGADDNASGVAGLLELARLLELERPSVKDPIEMVFYTLEEPPFFRGDKMGSAVHARSLKEAGVDVRYMISLEMIGYFSDEALSQKFLSPILYTLYPSTGDFIAVVSRSTDRELVRGLKRAMTANANIDTYSINAPDFVPGIDFSDHLNYWELGWPAAMITDTAFLRNDQYHRDGDTPGRLDYDRMAEVVRGLYAALVQN